MRVKVVKNKVAAPFRQAEFDIEYGQGISSEGCILDLGIEHNIVQKSGSFFSYEDERLGQGRNNVKAYLRENPDKLTRDRGQDLRDAGHPARWRARGGGGGGAGRRGSARGGARGRGAGGLAPLASDRADGGAAGGSRPFERAVELAYRSISRRDRTVAEVRAFLERKQRRAASRSSTPWSELAEAGWLDDERFAQRFAEDKRTIERWGSRADRARAAPPRRARGRDRGRRGRARTATTRWERHSRSSPRRPGRLDDDRERDRAWRLLVRKGYEPELAYEAVREFGRRAAA